MLVCRILSVKLGAGRVAPFGWICVGPSLRSSLRSTLSSMRESRFSPDDLRKMTADYERGASRRELAARYGVHPNTITSGLRRTGAETRAGPKRVLTADDEQLLLVAYESGESTAVIARAYGVTPQHVSRIALRLGAIPRRPGLPGRPRVLASIEGRVASDYAAGAGLIELSRRHGAAPETVLRTLKRAGVPRRASSRSKLS